jgi:predicted MFS family arabinose efflux permease
LFIIDAVISCIVAVIFYVSIPESKPAPHPSAEHESFSKTFTGYIRVLADKAYIAFIFASILTSITYQQMYNSLSVYLRDQHQIDPQGYGILLSTSAVVVILFQFWVTRQIKKKHPFVMMSLGALFYALGFALFGVFTTMVLFMTNIVIITMGEMIIMPTFQAVVAEFAPAEMRGRYMAIADLVWLIPSTVGPASAGYILDHYDPNLLWYIGGLLCVISAAGFLFLHARLGARPEFAPAQESASAS